MHWQELALGSLPLQATKDWTGILKAQVSSAFLQGSWLVDPCGPSQDLLGWAKRGSTRQASSPLKQQLGAGDQPGQKEKATELLVCVSGRGDRRSSPGSSAGQNIPVCSQTTSPRCRAPWLYPSGLGEGTVGALE